MRSDCKTRIIVDTNLWISFLFGKNLAGLLDFLSDEKVELVVSQELLNEVLEVASRPKLKKYFSQEHLNFVEDFMTQETLFCRINNVPARCRDSKDDYLLELALVSKANYLITGDKDYGQLVNENVWMLKPSHGGGFEKMGVEEIKSKYGLNSPLQVIDLLGLMGDTADNIPGCPGVGEKTAAKLLSQFKNIDDIIANAKNIKGALGKKIENSEEQIRLSRTLAVIRTDVPISFSFDDLKVKEPDSEKLKKIFSELEFRTLLIRMGAEPEINIGDFAGGLFDMVEPEKGEKQKSVNKNIKTSVQKRKNKPWRCRSL